MTSAGRAPARPAVFLDRDGTINDEVDYLGDPRRLRLYPGSAEAIRGLNEAGFAVVVVTNQSGVARGCFGEDDVAAVHAALAARLAERGARTDAVLYCPHHPTEGAPPYRVKCECRKPLPGLLERATADLGLDLARSWVVGDSVRDLEAGAALGVPGILVGTGKGADERAGLGRVTDPAPVFVADLPEAVRHILAASPGSPAGS